MSSASSLCNPSDKLQALLLLLLLPPFVHSLSSSSSNWIWIRWFSLFLFYSFFIWLKMGLLEEITVNSGEKKSHLSKKMSSLKHTPTPSSHSICPPPLLVSALCSLMLRPKGWNKDKNNPLVGTHTQKKDNTGEKQVSLTSSVSYNKNRTLNRSWN